MPLPPDPRDHTGEIARIAEQIHSQWPFIAEQKAYDFGLRLTGASPAEASVRISLWVLAQVIEHQTKR